MTFGSLFAGIGGMDLGLERAGLECRWQVEIDPFARRVLEKHWPDVRRHDDVRTFPPDGGDWGVDLIAGGFPCQDISYAGRGSGLAGERSGLWYEFARIIRDVRPRLVLVENVSALRIRGLAVVLGTLASLGYDAQWSCVPACSMGAPHLRDRMFIVANADGVVVPPRLRVYQKHDRERSVLSPNDRDDVRNRQEWMDTVRRNGGGHDGLPHRVDRIRVLGNAVVPQVAEWIGRRILESVNEPAALLKAGVPQ